MRLTAGQEADLRWYLLESGAELGERSPLGVQLDMARLRMGPSQNNRGPDLDRAAAVIRRHNAIRARLTAMTRRSRQVLIAAYCTDAEGLETYRQLGPVMLLGDAARGAYKRATKCARLSMGELLMWLSARLRTDTALRDAALDEADQMLTRACWEYRRRHD